MAHILVVEDDPGGRALLAEILESAGYQVETAEHGAAGLEALQRTTPDLVVLDLLMPEMDGWTFLQQRAAQNAAAEVPILVVSAASGDGLQAAKDLGAVYLRKPFDLEVLLTLVQQLTDGTYERARQEGAHLAARTLEHHVNNQLALTVGYSEMLATDPRVPTDVQWQAQEALKGALAVASTLRKLQDTRAFGLETDTGSPLVQLESDEPQRAGGG